MADSKGDYQVGPGRRPLHTRFKEGQSGNPGGRPRPPARSRAPTRSSRNSYFRPTPSAAHAAPATDRCRSAKSDQPRRARSDPSGLPMCHPNGGLSSCTATAGRSKGRGVSSHPSEFAPRIAVALRSGELLARGNHAAYSRFGLSQAGCRRRRGDPRAASPN